MCIIVFLEVNFKKMNIVILLYGITSEGGVLRRF